MEKLILNFPPNFSFFPFLHHDITDVEKYLKFYRKTIARLELLIPEEYQIFFYINYMSVKGD